MSPGTIAYQKKIILSQIEWVKWWLGRALGLSPSPEAIARVLSKFHPTETAWRMIRVGPAGDGGYVLPDDLEGLKAIFSPGVGEESGFEYVFAERGMTCHLLDASVDGPSIHHSNFRFRPLWLAGRTGSDSIDLRTWVEQEEPTGDLLLQMDIEGAEFIALDAASSVVLRRFRLILVEVHGIHRLLSNGGLRQVERLMNKLLSGHRVAHFNRNDCCPEIKLGRHRIPDVAELTFIRADRSPTHETQI